jgi:hypothetical protein
MSRQKPRPGKETEPRPSRSKGVDPHPRAHGTPRPRTDNGNRGPRPRPRAGTGPRPSADPRPGSGPRPVLHPGPALSPNRANRSRTLAALAWATAAAHSLGRRLLAVITGEVGRRLARAVGLTVVLAVVVTALYDRGEVPTAAAQQAVQAPSGGDQGGSAARGGTGARRKDPATLGGLRGRDRVARVGEKPAAVAAAWYAARHGVPRAKVKPLQQDRLSAKEVRVLVLADHGHGRLRTALVRLRHGADGWRVR